MEPIFLFLLIVGFTVAGAGLGIITGLVPGIHVNNVSIMIVALSASLQLAVLSIFGDSLSEGEILTLIVSLIIGCLITHTFLDVIPSVFLGAPDEDMALSVLPGHKLMLEGRGYEAIKCSALGSFGSVLVAMLLLFPTRFFMGSPVEVYAKLWPFVSWILILIVSLLILNESGERTNPRTAFGRKNPEKLVSIRVETISIQDDPVQALPGRSLEQEEKVKLEGEITRIHGKKAISVSAKGVEFLAQTYKASNFQPGQFVTVKGQWEGTVPWHSHLVQKGWALCVFFLSGFLGLIVLGTPGFVTNNWYPIPELYISANSALLFPLFTGLFGLSTLLMSIAETPAIPKQELENAPLGLSPLRQLRGILSGTLAGGLVGWYPGVTSASATVIASVLTI